MALQATNAGIDYQCRVSAWFLLNMLFENKLSNVIGTYPDCVLTKAQLEGSTEIDDLILSFENGYKFYYQIKRTINFSTLPNSEFYKVMSQFVKQFISDESNSRYILATTTNASKKLIDHLKKMLEGIRFSSIEDSLAQFNKSDKKLWEEFKLICETIYSNITSNVLTEESLTKLIERIHVETFDIEDGDNYENLVYLFINNNTDFNSKLLWNTMIKFALTLATNRRSINVQKIKKEFDLYLDSNSDDINMDLDNTESLDTSYIWKDYLVGTSDQLSKQMDIESNTLFIFDIYRFKEDGKKEIKYEIPNHLTLQNGFTFEILYRSSSMLGLERYVESTLKKSSEYGEVVFLPAHDSDDVNVFEELHLDWIKKEIQTNRKSNECVICGEIFNDSNGYIVEIDNNFEPNEAGMCHSECLRPVDRVMGLAGMEGEKIPNYMRGFDINKWIELIVSGQSMISGLSVTQNHIHHVAWDPNYNSFTDRKYCIRTKLENGDYVYAKDRGKVDRLSKQAAKRLAKQFDDNHKKALETDDPICYSENSLAYGNYKSLRKLIPPTEKLLACVETEMVKYTKHISKLYDICENFYAPLIMFYLEEDIFEMGGIVPILSNPLDIEKYFDSWGVFVSGVKPFINTRVIESDSEFDNIVRELKSDGYSVIINPKLGRNNELISGAILYSLSDIMNTQPSLSTI